MKQLLMTCIDALINTVIDTSKVIYTNIRGDRRAEHHYYGSLF